ncbi:site-specific DNA-methyltransferase [Pseudonocardia sediminis]|uniref:site-specific DNA-methyltransferase n=1 Tax=Pseudonocardia sediminis TaxID=1397368 RepID=UPI00102A1115|nr:site-specific DNA-methyltransferase [Pseudonocardia sediminis]
MVAGYNGGLELTWTNKDKALLSTGDGKYDYTFVDRADYRVSEVRLMHEIERVEADSPQAQPAGLPEPTTDNLLITGDAMHALDVLAKVPEYSERYLDNVKLVYIDPPFNTGQAFTNYDDNVEHSVWLTMLRDRIRQIKPLLSDDGSVWVHLDDAEVHRCRSVLDEEFGAENFVAEVVWQKVTSPRNDTTGISVSHDSLLVYRKTDRWFPNRMKRLASSNTSRYRSRDGDPVAWRDGDATAGKAATNHPMVYAIQHPTTGGLMYPTRGRCWGKAQTWFLDQMNEYAKYELRDIGDENRRASICGTSPELVKAAVPAIMLAEPLEDAAQSARARHSTGPWPELVFLDLDKENIQRKKHLTDDGRVPETLWFAADVGGSLRGKNQVTDLFPDRHAFATPKPEELLQRIIHIGSNPGDIVLDCYGGSGTTSAVAQKMGRRWVTSELIPATVATYTKPRLKRVVEGRDPGGVTTSAERVANGDLPPGMTPDEAQEFNRLLRKVGKVADVDETALRALRHATKTESETTTLWHGGGGFTHLEVRPSMFESIAGIVVLAEWATQGDLTRAMCAQLGVRYLPDGIFAARRGQVRYVVIDGLVGNSTISAILDQLPEKQIVEVWATQIDPDAEKELRIGRIGSRLTKIPEAVLDTYRRHAAKTSPFNRPTPAQEGPST